jgi:hypothetical protein
MSGYDSERVGVYSGQNMLPPSANDYAFWTVNNSALYLFGGWGSYISGNGTLIFLNFMI